MENQFFKSTGINNNQLKLIIGLISIRLLAGLYITIGISHAVNAFYIINIFFKICDMICILYVYKFVGIDLKQKLFLFLFVLIIFVDIYSLFTTLYMLFAGLVNGAPIYSIFANQFYNYIPLIIVFPALIIIAVQLISNKAAIDLQPAIKFLGVCYIIQVIGEVLMMGLQQLFHEFLFFYSFIYFALFALPYVAMIYMYVTAMKEDIHNEEI